MVVCLRCLLHHIRSHIAYTFRENRNFVFIIIAQFMMSANSRIRLACRSFSFVCITPSHYNRWASLPEDIELIKCLSDIFVECVSKIKHIFSVIHYKIYGLCVFNLPISFVMIERKYTLSHHHHQIESMNYYPLFRVRSWNNGIRCMSLYPYVLLDRVITALGCATRHVLLCVAVSCEQFCCDPVILV